MLKNLYLWACLACSPLLGEVMGDVEVQFPPSNFEWKLFCDSGLSFFIDEEAEEEEEPVVSSLYAHREGDALELFYFMQLSEEGDEEEAETLEEVQARLDAALHPFFPNHKFTLVRFEDHGNEGFFSWVVTDGVQDLMHGSARVIADPSGQRKAILSYSTTALRTERNEMVWTEVLNQARFVN